MLTQRFQRLTLRLGGVNNQQTLNNFLMYIKSLNVDFLCKKVGIHWISDWLDIQPDNLTFFKSSIRQDIRLGKPDIQLSKTPDILN